jgi:hypothetical protein
VSVPKIALFFLRLRGIECLGQAVPFQLNLEVVWFHLSIFLTKRMQTWQRHFGRFKKRVYASDISTDWEVRGNPQV